MRVVQLWMSADLYGASCTCRDGIDLLLSVQLPVNCVDESQVYIKVNTSFTPVNRT